MHALDDDYLPHFIHVVCCCACVCECECVFVSLFDDTTKERENVESPKVGEREGGKMQTEDIIRQTYKDA